MPRILSSIAILFAVSCVLAAASCNGGAPRSAPVSSGPPPTVAPIATRQTAAPVASPSTPVLPWGPARFAYLLSRSVTSSGSLDSVITQLALDPATGEPSVAKSYTSPGFSAVDMLLDPTGRWLVVTTAKGNGPSLGSLASFAIAPTSGAISFVSSIDYAGSFCVSNGCIGFTGSNTLAALSLDGTIAAISFDAKTGQLAFKAAPVPLGGPGTTIWQLAVVPNRPFVFSSVRDFGAWDILPALCGPGGTFTTSVATVGSPWLAHLSVPPSGDFLYSASSNGVTTLSIDPTSGTLHAGATLPTPSVSVSTAQALVSFDRRGALSYVVVPATQSGLVAEQLDVCSVDPTTGALSAKTTAAVVTPGDAALAFAIEPSGQYGYLVTRDTASISIHAYAVDGRGGVRASGRWLNFPMPPTPGLLAFATVP